MSKSIRDDFTKPIKDTLAKRAGFLCSNPDCRKATIGAHSETEKSTSIGEAAHITAAAKGGKRYNPLLTADQRGAIDNGIWLCCTCATLIDKDEKVFTEQLLYQWKGGVEAESKLKLRFSLNNENHLNISNSKPNPIIEVDFAGHGRGRFNNGYSMKNPIEMKDGLRVMVPGNKPIFFWHLNWRFKLTIYNNSNYAAYNVKIQNINAVEFSEFEILPLINNIPPLENKELDIKYEDSIESTHTEADEMLAPRYPSKFNNHLVLKLIYLDENRNEHVSLVEFEDGEIINTKIQG